MDTLEHYLYMKDKVHFGDLIRNELAKQGRTIVWLAMQLNCDYSTLVRTLKKEYIRTDKLLEICEILEYDFFAFGTSLVSDNKRYKKK